MTLNYVLNNICKVLRKWFRNLFKKQQPEQKQKQKQKQKQEQDQEMFPLNVVSAASGSGEERIADYIVTAETDGFLTGYSRLTPFGVLTPDQTYNGNQIINIHQIIGDQMTYVLADGALNDDESFSSIALSGIFNTGQQTLTILREDAEDLGSDDNWLWLGITDLFLDGNDYDMVITYITR